MSIPKNYYNSVDVKKLKIDEIETISSTVGEIVSELTDESDGLIARVTALETTVGDNDSGLVKEVNDIVRLPDVSSDNEGEVLTVDASGNWVVSDTLNDTVKRMQKTLDNLLNPPTTKIHEFDFTTGSAVDTIDGSTTAAISGAVMTSGTGVTFSGANQSVSVASMLAPGRTVKAVFGACSSSISDERGFTLCSDGAGVTWDRRSQKWNWTESWSGSNTHVWDILPQNPNLISNGSIQFVCNSLNEIDVYINDQYVDTITSNNIANNKAVVVGSSMRAYYSMILKSITVWGA